MHSSVLFNVDVTCSVSSVTIVSRRCGGGGGEALSTGSEMIRIEQKLFLCPELPSHVMLSTQKQFPGQDADSTAGAISSIYYCFLILTHKNVNCYNEH